jgi:hypothetical protein
MLSITGSMFQGSILGLTLFLCYINDIFNATSLATLLFADNTAWPAENKNLHDLINNVNYKLNKLEVTLKANKMVVNVSKTNCNTFHTKGKKVDLDGYQVVLVTMTLMPCYLTLVLSTFRMYPC